MTREEVATAFKEELQALLNKYNAEMEADDYHLGYPESGEDIRMTVSIPSIHDDNGNTIRPRTEIDLGQCMFPEEVAP